MTELIPPRPGEELDLDVLAPFLDQVFGEGDGHWQVQQYSAGHSNLTYLLSSGTRQVVLRRPPMGPIPPRAHDMVREARFLSALQPWYRWAPRVYAVSDTDSLLGAPFFLMEPRQGVLIDRNWAQQGGFSPDVGRRLSRIMVERLVDLHGIHWMATELALMVKPAGFLERQVSGWISRYERAKTEEIPGVAELCRWLQERVPRESEATVIHYDYKLNNVLFAKDLSNLSGVFDWEMATVGDPLMDLAVAVSYWTEAGDPTVFQSAFGETPMTVEPGFYTRREWVQDYSTQSGRDIRHFGYYLTFAYFKLAVIIAQIYYRYRNGQTHDPRFQQFSVVTRQLLQVAMDTHLKSWGG